jgi:hypothetical protein
MVVCEVFVYNDAGQGRREIEFTTEYQTVDCATQQAIDYANEIADSFGEEEYDSVVVYKSDVDYYTGEHTNCETIYEIVL